MTNNQQPNRETFKQWHKDPANWKWGILYYNKNDKRIFPPKRSKLGWTINFANPLSIMALVAITLILVTLIYLLTGHI